MIELSPCRKCRGTGEVWHTTDDRYIVVCPKCHGTTAVYQNKEAAVRAWETGKVVQKGGLK